MAETTASMESLSMGVRLKNHETPAAGLHRILREETEAIIHEMAAIGKNPPSAIHEARKHVKRARAVLRLLRGPLDAVYLSENQALRDLGRKLSPLRDADARRESFSAVLRASGHHGFPTIRKSLSSHSSTKKIEPPQPALALEIHERVTRLEVPSSAGFGFLESGLKKGYRQARKAALAASASSSSADLHEWRKRVKDLGYHLQILKSLWPKVLKALHAEIDELGETLGQDHDLSVLEQLISDPASRISKAERKAFSLLASRRHAHLRKRSHLLGRRIFAEKPGAFCQRLREYWKASRKD